MVLRGVWIFGILALTLVLTPMASVAAEHGGATAAAPADATKEHGGSAPAASASTQQDGGAAPATPEVPAAVPVAPPAPPALKPIVITFSGDLSSVNAQASPAMITVQDRYGVKKEIEVPAEAKLSQGTAAKSLADLKVGDKLTVEYTYDVSSGKRAAQSIIIGEGSPSL